ncbi:MAG: indole-3-glycerol phosphate synthase TrpC [Thermoleophilia bacterium]|nr:indole-3-glycerol phosphate synthase TrpC [Thermoleophilia bacterium]
MPRLSPRQEDPVNSQGECLAARPDQYLVRILAAVRARLRGRQDALSLAELKKICRTARPRPSLREALVGPELALIAEVKRASPSAGAIRPELRVHEVVKVYEEAGARAISVLTEQDYFGGSPEDLIQAARSTTLPILRKDFIVDVYQIYEAKAWGASGVLLIAAVLSDEELHDFARVAADLGLDVLIEAHDIAELGRAMAVEGALVGINNRDLRTFEVNIDISVELARFVAPDRVLVAESGIHDHRDVERLAAAGVDAVLVGEALLRGPDVGAAVRRLLEPVPLRVARQALEVKRGEIL